MSLLTAVQSAARRLVGQTPATLFGTTDKIALELLDLANESAVAIAKAHDWQKLFRLHTVTGDGETEEHNLPSDYDRMPLKSNVYFENMTYPLVRAKDLDEWLELELTPAIGVPGFWILIAGTIGIRPVIALNDTAKFYYITNQIISGGKTQFTANDDAFLLPERLITLSLVWRWRQMKRLEYGEDMQTFCLALTEEAGKDKGARILKMGRPRMYGDVNQSYPGIIESA